MGLLRRPTPGGIVEDGRLGRPCGPGALRAIRETQFAATPPIPYSDISPVARTATYQLGHQPVTVIWDNLGAHHAGDLHAWAATQPWLVLEYLPSYAPELDPVEGLWANLKGRELANRCCADRRELIATAQVGSIRARRDPDLLRSFLAGTGLTI